VSKGFTVVAPEALAILRKGVGVGVGLKVKVKVLVGV
jgi:hypothetical protein